MSLNDQLIYYAEKGRLEKVNELIHRGAQIDAEDNSALIKAAFKSHLDVVCRLIELGADVNTRESKPLRVAAELGNLEVVKIMIEAGANVDACNNQALRSATEYRHLDVMRELCAAGADPDDPGGGGYQESSLDKAKRSNDKEAMVDILTTFNVIPLTKPAVRIAVSGSSQGGGATRRQLYEYKINKYQLKLKQLKNV